MRMRLLVLLLGLFLFASCGKDVEGLTPEEYISQNNLQATALENGVYIIIHDAGSAIRPDLDQVVDVSYTGRLTDGYVFDSNDDFKALLGDVIQGWYIGLKEIGEGGSCTLIIPHKMGFGDISNGPIPPKSTLVFEIELKNVFSTRTVEEYILDNNLNTIELDKGVQLAIHSEGNEVRPSLESEITVNYTGKFTNELIFDRAENIKLKLKNLIEGWQIGLQEIGEGGSCTLILPSDVAYGSSGAGTIPPNTPIVFNIELIKVN
jgi:FKBP-type peptidyl-prolyl cis-trans isomerase